jgi:hypothetical protein
MADPLEHFGEGGARGLQLSHIMDIQDKSGLWRIATIRIENDSSIEAKKVKLSL